MAGGYRDSQMESLNRAALGTWFERGLFPPSCPVCLVSETAGGEQGSERQAQRERDGTSRGWSPEGLCLGWSISRGVLQCFSCQGSSNVEDFHFQTEVIILPSFCLLLPGIDCG